MLDGSIIYGNDENRVRLLRTFYHGKVYLDSPLRASQIPALGMVSPPPTSRSGDSASRGPPRSELRVGGDPAANVNPIGMSVTILFLREHNRLCDEFAKKHPDWDDEKLYQEARRWYVGHHK